MLRHAATQGTGRAATSGWPASLAAGKTGTSDAYRDAWFAGYTPALTCVVWVGRDDNSSLPGTGATLAAPLWAQFMRAASGLSPAITPAPSSLARLALASGGKVAGGKVGQGGGEEGASHRGASAGGGEREKKGRGPGAFPAEKGVSKRRGRLARWRAKPK